MKYYIIPALAFILCIIWLDGFGKGKVEARAEFEDADELVRREADWLTNLQLAQIKEQTHGR